MKPSSIVRAVNVCLDKHRPVFIWGPPGVGKSDVMAQIAAQRKVELRDVRLSLMDPVDIKGYPVPNLETGQMNWLPGDFLPAMKVKGKANTTKGILFLDEMNSAPASVQAAAYQLVLNRKIGNYALPAGWDVVAAGNRDKDRSVTHRMPAALANRLVHLDFDVSLDDWSAWALDNKIETEVLAFLRFKANLLHDFRPDENPRAFPSPRSWSFVSELCKEKLPADERLELLKGTVGEGAAAEFTAFLEVYRDLPSVDQIMLNPETTPVPDKPSTLYALATSLGLKAVKSNFDRIMLYVNRMPPEFQVVTVRDAVRHDNTVHGTKAYTKWSIDNSEMLM